MVLRSAFYMDYLLAALPMIQAQQVNGSATKADARFPMVATMDVAREAADRLIKRDFTAREVTLLLGPEDVTMSEATQAIGKRLGMPDLPYVEFPPEGVKGALIGAGMSDQVAGLMVDMQLALGEGLYFEGIQREAGSTTPTRLENFLSEALSDHGREKTEATR